MIDKQKLLQWIQDKKYVFSEPYESSTQEACYKSISVVLTRLSQEIELGAFEPDEEEPGPRFAMDAQGNLTPIEE